jgi:hypothetical protein
MCFISWQEVYTFIDVVSYAGLIKLKFGRDKVMQGSIEAQEVSYSGDCEEFSLPEYAALYSVKFNGPHDP